MDNNPKKSKALIITFIITMILLGGLYYLFANREKLFTPKSSQVENKDFTPLGNNGSPDGTNTGGTTSNKVSVRIPGSVVSKDDLNKLTTSTEDSTNKNFVTKSFQAVSNTVTKASDTVGGFVKSLFGINDSTSNSETVSIPGTIIAENNGVVTIAVAGLGFDADNNPISNPTINISGSVITTTSDGNIIATIPKPVVVNADNTISVSAGFGDGNGTDGGNLGTGDGFGTPIDDPNGSGSNNDGGFGSGDTGGFGSGDTTGGGFGSGNIPTSSLPTPNTEVPSSNTKPVTGISLPNTPTSTVVVDKTPTNMCPEDDPLTFTADEQKQLDDLLRQFYKLTPFLKTEEEVLMEQNTKIEYDNLVDQAKELTAQCKVQKVVNPETGDIYTGPQEVKDNPYYQGKKKSISSVLGGQKTVSEKIEECNSIYASISSQNTPYSSTYDYSNTNIDAIHEADRAKCMQDAYNTDTTTQVDYTDSYLGSLNFEYWTPSRPQKTSEPYKTFEDQFSIW